MNDKNIKPLNHLGSKQTIKYKNTQCLKKKIRKNWGKKRDTPPQKKKRKLPLALVQAELHPSNFIRNNSVTQMEH